MKNIFKTIWNSKTFETIAEINYEVMTTLGECIVEAFSGSTSSSNNSCSYTSSGYSCSGYSCSNEPTTSIKTESSYSRPKEESVEDKTYEYWMTLSSLEQQEYYENNEYLKRWGENYRYEDRCQMARSVANIARIENRAFTNKYDRY